PRAGEASGPAPIEPLSRFTDGTRRTSHSGPLAGQADRDLSRAMTRGAGGLRDQGRTPLARAAALLVGAAALGASGCAEDTALQLFPPSCTDDCAQGAGGSGTSGQAGTGGVAGAINSTSTGSQGGPHGCGARGSRFRTSERSRGAPAGPSGEYNPVLLAPRPDSTSLLGYRRADALEISVLALDASDAVERELF